MVKHIRPSYLYPCKGQFDKAELALSLAMVKQIRPSYLYPCKGQFDKAGLAYLMLLALKGIDILKALECGFESFVFFGKVEADVVLDIFFEEG